MEPERKIEKLLRAYAKKRRAEAGDASKLHPATRRLLQGEVARHAPKPEPDEEDSLSLWQLLRQRWAFLLTFTLVVFLGAVMLLPSLSSAKRRAPNVTAMSQLKQIGLAAQMAAEENHGKLPASLDALTNGFIPEKMLTDPVSGRRFIYAAGGENLDDLHSNAVLAYSPVDKNGRAVLLADGRVEYANRARFAELTNRGDFQLALAGKAKREQMESDRSKIPVAAPMAVTAAKPAEEREKLKSGVLDMNAAKSGELAASKPSPTVTEQESTGLPESIVTVAGTAKFRLTTNAAAVAGESGLAANSSTALPPPAARVTKPASQLAKALTLAYRNIAPQTNYFDMVQGTATLLPQARALEQQNAFRNGFKPAQKTPVLANFQVSQNGNLIRVVDGDGSVYRGSLQPVAAIVPGTPPSGASNATTARLKDESAMTNNREQPLASNYYFQVVGTNRTLQQNVVFSGNLLPMTNLTVRTQQTFVGGNIAAVNGQVQSGLPSQLPLLPWSDLRITGTAVVAGTNHVKISATPLIQ